MRIDIITIFPDYFTPLELSLIGKARRSGLLDIRLHDLRSWTYDRHHTVDDTPYGGGPGMVMKPEPWGEALDAVVGPEPAAVPRLILPTPSGVPFTQRHAGRLAGEPWLVFACGRYEGIDSRVAVDAGRRMPVEELSIGDYVLAGGESATLVMVETISRLLPGVLGNAESAEQDSFAPGAMDDLVEGPVYTKPAEWRGQEVPPVLLSGHHGAVDRWRRDEALRKTARNRPDLLRRIDPEVLDRRDREVLDEARLQVGSDSVAD
ncbi:tRNA (guanosine(37)-N1)-methyltransferase TrmD [Marinitenerispora sediminis]|uniref:tRNA (guanine-N(1)-)-methyltransferase n=1 Tax=Marinitenerispora sediminis TaxID=1931232 RepID=A0A368T3P8_9ACTN|nr:tRNA (guanosine(37)-N1)-methyltransferase TrmD [Marinitenerispora sediminis]RCV48243.1 tRNA (guanosine(37)-N1)-methyltransferase TrmD [Marinitenerispora sediminis]RCV49442.1 tRNA (guanosine(37)-N1)-methyltransferase TrmD [Marinitenerispora sediminis]RCV56800.1 tRNA (guanosine(37)-N1)-methyltransferase TrmD [Marinitenerispora sediminis]